MNFLLPKKNVGNLISCFRPMTDFHVEADKEAEKEVPVHSDQSQPSPSPTTESSKSTADSDRLAAERLAAWRREGQLYNPLHRVENLYGRSMVRMDQSQTLVESLAEIHETIETIATCHLRIRSNFDAGMFRHDGENDKNGRGNDNVENGEEEEEEEEEDFGLSREMMKKSTMRWRTERFFGESERRERSGDGDGDVSVFGEKEEEEEDEKTKKERKKYFSLAAMAERAAKYNQSQRKENSRRVHDWVIHHANAVALNQ